MFVDLWDWFYQYEVVNRSDPLRGKLPQLYNLARQKFENASEEALMLLTQGRDLAEKHDEPCWQLFFNYWISEIYIYYKDDQALGLDLAVRNAVEARKPQYSACPVRARVLRALIDAYATSDPISYSDQILENLDYLEQNVALDIDTWRLIESRRATLALEFNNLDEAQGAALHYMERSDNNEFRLRGAYDMLCEIAYRRGNIEEALKHAQAGETVSRRVHNSRRIIITFVLWQAVCQRKLGNEAEAQRLYNTAILRATSGEGKITCYAQNLVCEYHEIGGEFEQALQWRSEQINQVISTHNPHLECECRRKLCRLRALMGLPFEEELAAAHEAANRLLKPDYFIAKLHRIVQGDLSEVF